MKPFFSRRFAARRWVTRGFTLIELLVVIAIISILAAILFPVFAQARGKARQAVALSNIKQMGLAAMMYVQDYDEQYMEIYREHEGGGSSGWPAFDDGEVMQPNGEPYGWLTAPRDLMAARPDLGITPNWAYVLLPYAKSSGIFADPSGYPVEFRPATSTDNSGFTYSSWIADTGTSGMPAAKLADIKRPAETILFWSHGKNNRYVDIQGWNGDPAWWGDEIVEWHCPHCYPDWIPRHNGGRVYLFADGHAKWARDSQMTIRKFPEKWDWHRQN